MANNEPSYSDLVHIVQELTARIHTLETTIKQLSSPSSSVPKMNRNKVIARLTSNHRVDCTFEEWLNGSLYVIPDDFIDFIHSDPR